MNFSSDQQKALIFTIIGLAFFFGYFPKLKSGIGSQSWPSVEGTVLESEPDYRQDPNTNGRYLPFIKYSYQVEGIEFTSNRISFKSPLVVNGRRDDVKVFLGQYPVGSKTKVIYNPNRPGEAVLIPGYAFSHVVFTVSAAILFFVGIAFYFRQRNQAASSGSKLANQRV